MSRYARQTPALRIVDVRSLDRPQHRNYAFIEQFLGQALPTEALLGLWPLRRILAQVRQQNGRTMVVEELGPCEELAEENEDIQAELPAFGPSHSTAWRLSFFSQPFSGAAGVAEVEPEAFLGYAILKLDRLPAGLGPRARVYESVVRPSGELQPLIPNPPRWTCLVAGREFPIEGYAYAQQNGLTTVCAHVAIRTVAARFDPAGGPSYRRMNEIIRAERERTGAAAGGGPSVEEVILILEEAGVRCFAYNYEDIGPETRSAFQEALHGAVESGYPAILCFASDQGREGPVGHAIPIFGHSFSADTWVPGADRIYFRVAIGPQTEYIPSESWVTTYVGHDDNLGSNFCIPRNYLRTRTVCDPKVLFPNVRWQAGPCSMDLAYVIGVIGTFPRAVRVDPVQAEAFAADYLFPIIRALPEGLGQWMRRLKQYCEKRHLVLRPVLVDAPAYAAHLRRVRTWTGQAFPEGVVDGLARALQQLGGQHLWMVEVSVPDLFAANRRKLGEVLLWAEREQTARRDFASYVLARLPGVFVLPSAEEARGARFAPWPCAIADHVELFGCEETP